MQQSDNHGNLPLFHACNNNDITFFKWLFQQALSNPATQLAVTSAVVTPRSGLMSRDYTENISDDDFEEVEIDIPPSPSIAEVMQMNPFTMVKSGKTILHILAEKGLYKILSIIVQVSNQVEGFEFSSLCIRRSNKLPLPIEKALTANNVECVQILIDLTIMSYQFPQLLQDRNILRVATVTKNIKNVELLIKFGFHESIELAITLAANYKLYKIVSLLLFWKVTIQNYLNFSHRNDIHQFFRNGKLFWNQLELPHIDPTWLCDALSAMLTTEKVLTDFIDETHDYQEYNLVILRELGMKCIEYFEGAGTITTRLAPMLTSHEYIKIVSINLSENQLEAVPQELFQLVTLSSLDLKYNKIKTLPTSDDSDCTLDLYVAKLETLCLDYNELVCLPDNMIWGLANSLQSLSVQNNKLENLPPGLWLMPNLSTLKLATNNLSSLHSLSNFTSREMTEKISSLEVLSDGTLKVPDGMDDDEFLDLKNHARSLVSLCRTVYAVKFPTEKVTNDHLLHEVIQLYRSKVIDQEENADVQTPVLSGNRSLSLAGTICDDTFVSKLDFLDLSFNNFEVFPCDLPCVAPNLGKLDLSSNSVCGLDIVHDLPKDINSLILRTNKIRSVSHVRSINLPCGCPSGLLTIRKTRHDSYCKHSQHEILEKLDRLVLDNNRLSFLPVVKKLRSESQLNLEYPSRNQMDSPLFPNMAILSIAHNLLKAVPPDLFLMRRLNSLNLSYNEMIVELPEDMGLIDVNYITLIKMDGVKPRNVPRSILNSSSRKLVKYLNDVKLRSRPFRSIKLMLVGDANKGKTSLLLSLTKKGQMTHYNQVIKGTNEAPLSTVGVELGEFKYSPAPSDPSRPIVTFMTWDFGGQEEYYATNQCFITTRSLFLLLWNIQDGEEGIANLKPWLEKIESCAPKSPVIIIGTHLDQVCPNSTRERDKTVRKLEVQLTATYITSPEHHNSTTYPTISSKCYFVDVRNGKMMDKLRDYIYSFAINFKPTSSFRRRDDTMEGTALLEKLIPESHTVLQQFVRRLAEKCQLLGLHPVFTKAELVSLELFKREYIRQTSFMLVVMFCLSFGSYGVTLWFPTYIDQVNTQIDMENFEKFCNGNVTLKSDDSIESYCGCENTIFANFMLKDIPVHNFKADNAIFNNVDFINVSFVSVQFNGAEFSGCHFSESNFSNTYFNATNFDNVTFNSVSLQSCSLCSMTGSDVEVEGLILQNVDVDREKIKYDTFNTSQFNQLLNLNESDCAVDDRYEKMVCRPSESRLYRDTFIITASAFPGNVASAFAVYFLRRNYWLAFSLFASTLSAFLLYAANTELFVVVMLCIFNAVSIPAWNDSSLLIAELYPTYLRSTAAGVHLIMARIGAIFGTNIFGAFVRVNPSIPIILVAAILFVGAIAALGLPKTTRKTLLK